jgi:hypothetical protein
MLDSAGDLLEVFGKAGKTMKTFKAVAGGLGACCFVLEIAMAFMPKQPSATELAIAAAVVKLSKKMDDLHKAQMGMLSAVSRN